MAFGAVPQGTANRLLVGTAAPPTTPVGGLQGWGYPGDKATSEEEFYNDFPTITTIGPGRRTVTFRLKYAKADSGQDIIKSNFDNPTPPAIYASVLIDGTTGEYLPSICSHWEPSGGGPRTAADVAVTLSQMGDPVDVGGGF